MTGRSELVNSFLTTREAASVLRIRPDHLARLRSQSKGPPYVQRAPKGPCLYNAEDLMRWMEQHTIQPEFSGSQR